jgi:BAI1-associated protein 3
LIFSKIDNLEKDSLHLDIWDHDDEFSVVEAARKLNEVKSLKGLDRYFKQIAQSARTHKSDKNSHVDDFLGSINIKPSAIPSNGIDQWYDLEGRSEKSNVEGEIRLKLNLTTREDRGNNNTDECNYSEFNEHEKLMRIFIDCDLAKFRGKNEDWNGDLSKEAETILHQHAIQGNITEIQIWVMCVIFMKPYFETKILIYFLF